MNETLGTILGLTVLLGPLVLSLIGYGFAIYVGIKAFAKFLKWLA